MKAVEETNIHKISVIATQQLTKLEKAGRKEPTHPIGDKKRAIG